jgi:hypothetical protein
VKGLLLLSRSEESVVHQFEESVDHPVELIVLPSPTVAHLEKSAVHPTEMQGIPISQSLIEEGSEVQRQNVSWSVSTTDSSPSSAAEGTVAVPYSPAWLCSPTSRINGRSTPDTI